MILVNVGKNLLLGWTGFQREFCCKLREGVAGLKAGLLNKTGNIYE
jgi:hypothetical protein